MREDQIDLLLAYADEKEPVLGDGLPRGSSEQAPKPKKAVRGDDAPDWRRTDADPNDLALQHWGVVAPEGKDGDRLLEAMAPLLRLRERGQNAHVMAYRVPPDMEGRAPVAWKDEVYWSEEETDDAFMASYQSEAEACAENRADPTNNKERGHLWMLRNDLRGYVLLGDPAARLPITKKIVAPAQINAVSTPEVGRVNEAAKNANSVSAKKVAVLSLIQGQEAPIVIANRAGTTLTELFAGSTHVVRPVGRSSELNHWYVHVPVRKNVHSKGLSR